MKIALVLPGSYWYCPYVKIYEDILKSQSISCDIISWDRDGINENHIISFTCLFNPFSNRIKKLINYFKYRHFIAVQIRKNNYDKLIIFGPQMGLLLYALIKGKYNKKVFLDYRDISIEQIFKKRFKKLLECCSKIAISSPGFKKVLPKGFIYIISHNINESLLSNSWEISSNYTKPFNQERIVISTIGAIRDIGSNIELLNSLKNNEKFIIQFIGRGSEQISKLSPNISNAFYKGYYQKEDEHKFIVSTDFINIYYPHITTHSLALSNRFYNALVYKRPMIVTSNSIQGDYVENYKLGLALDNCQNLEIKIQSYIKTFDFDEFTNNCNLLLEMFSTDFIIFKSELINFINE